MSSLGVRVNWENGELAITVSGTGDTAEDDRNVSQAVHMLNSHGSGTLYIQGEVIITHHHAFNGPISLKGIGANAQLSFRTPTYQMFTWNRSWHHSQEKWFPIRVARDGDAVIHHEGTATDPKPENGDWVLIWSDDVLTGMTPHHIGGTQHPMEMHQVENVHEDKLFTSDFVADKMVTNARGIVLPKDRIADGIVIDNLLLHWDGGPMPNYATMFRFNLCTNVHITDSVRTTRNGPGAIWFANCGNCVSRMGIEGIKRDNGVYGFVAGVVNGLDIDGIFRGTRHVFTTTSGHHSGLGRWGTPLNVVFDGLVYNSPEHRSATSRKGRIAFDTHAEGYGIVCRADFVGAAQGGSVDYMAQSRSRGTIFKGCTFRGGGVHTSVGVRVLAEDCKVENCTFQRLWYGVRNDWPNSNRTLISHNSFDSCSSFGVQILEGADTEVSHNTFRNCGRIAGVSPPATKSVIKIGPRATGTHKIYNNSIPKTVNYNSIDIADNEADIVDMKGNTLTGYGSLNPGVEPSNPHRTDLIKETFEHNWVD